MNKKTKINSLEELFELYPNKRWDYDIYSLNEDLTWERILKNWIETRSMIYWNNLSRHRNVTWQVVVDNIDLPWNWDCISQNPNITWKIVNTANERKQRKEKWSLYHLSANPMTTMEYIKYHPKKTWYGFGFHLSHNPNLTWTFIENHLKIGWDWYQISQNRTVTWQIVLDNPDLPWNYGGMSLNPNITWQIVVDNIDSPWNFDCLTKNPNMTCQIIKNNRFQQHATVKAFSQNINITWQVIEKNLNQPWDWFHLSANPHISFEEATDTLWKPWCFERIHPGGLPPTFLELKHELHLNGLTYGDFLELQ